MTIEEFYQTKSDSKLAIRFENTQTTTNYHLIINATKNITLPFFNVSEFNDSKKDISDEPGMFFLNKSHRSNTSVWKR